MSRAPEALLLTAALAALAPAALAQADCSGFWVAPSGEIATHAGRGGVDVVVYAPVGCSFTIVRTTTWMGAYPEEFTTSASETTVEVFWEAATGQERSGSIGIQAASGETQFVNVRQAGACAFSVDSTRFSFNRDGGSGYFVVGADDGCYWQVLANYWINVDGSTQQGTHLVEFSVQSNLDDASRDGELVVAQVSDAGVEGKVTVHVSQSATDERGPVDVSGGDASSSGSGDDAGPIERWVADSIVESPGPAWPVALAAVAATAVVFRRVTRGPSG